MVGVGTIFIGPSDSEVQYNYTNMSLLQTHPQDEADSWEAEIDTAYNTINYGDSVLIKRDGTTIFKGYVDTIEPRFGDTGLLIYVSGPCWKGAMDKRVMDQKMVGSGTTGFDKSAFVDCYPEEVLKFIIQIPQSDIPRISPEAREGEGIYPDNWTIYIPCVVHLDDAGYVNCISSDIGKMVLDDGGDTGLLLAYNNALKLWFIDFTFNIAATSAMSILAGSGQGTAELNSSFAGNIATRNKMKDRENEAYGSNWESTTNQTLYHAILLDLGGTYHISGIRIECRANREDYPSGNKRCAEYMRNYMIQLSQYPYGTWATAGQKYNNMAQDVIHGIDPTSTGQSKRWITIFLTSYFNAKWSITEIYVYKSDTIPYNNRIPVTEGTVSVLGNPVPPLTVDSYMSISQIFQMVTELTSCPEGGDSAVPSNVTLGFVAKRLGGGDAVLFKTYIWEGSYVFVKEWNSITELTTSYASYESNVTSTLNTLAKINATKLKFEITGAGDSNEVRITYAYLKVTIGGIQYILGVRGRDYAGQTFTTNGYEPWIEDEWEGVGTNDGDSTYIESKTVNQLSEGYLFRKVEGNRFWEWWIDPINKTWNFKRRRGSDLSASVEFKYDSTGIDGHFEDIEKTGNVQEIYNRLKVIAGGEGLDQEVNSSDWTEDSASITANGLYEGTIDAPSIDKKEAANAYATNLLAEYANPRTTIRVRIYDSYASNTWGIGDDITLTDTHTGLSGKYRVMSLRREFEEGETVTIVASKSSTYLPKFKPQEELQETARKLSLVRRGRRHAKGWGIRRVMD